MAILFLPRQFQLAVVENVNEEHLRKAIWLFPLYLLAINIFVIPVALSGVLRFQDGSVDPGATVRFRFFVTDPTPVPEFYLLQDPQLLMARRWPPFRTLAQRPASR